VAHLTPPLAAPASRTTPPWAAFGNALVRACRRLHRSRCRLLLCRSCFGWLPLHQCRGWIYLPCLPAALCASRYLPLTFGSFLLCHFLYVLRGMAPTYSALAG